MHLANESELLKLIDYFSDFNSVETPRKPQEII